MAKIHEIDVQQVQAGLANGSITLIDVREKGEYKTAHIAGSHLLPLSQIDVRRKNLPPHKGTKLVIHCLSGRRSQMAAQCLIELGIKEDVYNMTGGITAWQQANLPVVKSKSRLALPLNQQVFVVVGLITLVIAVLTYSVSIKWIGAQILVSMGLLFAGLTGNCALATILNKMPWNK